jgi:hypothetical protein
MMARKRSILYLTNKGLRLDLSAHALSKIFARYEIFKMVLNLSGDIVDYGVYRGASLFSWRNLIEIFAVRPDGAYHQWRKDPSRELSIALVADERFGRATGWIEAS